MEAKIKLSSVLKHHTMKGFKRLGGRPKAPFTLSFYFRYGCWSDSSFVCFAPGMEKKKIPAADGNRILVVQSIANHF
jgi:hypothetical protein